MNNNLSAWQQVEKLVWTDVLFVIAALLVSQLVVLLVRRVLRDAAQRVSPHRRLTILRIVPLARVLIRFTAIVVIVPILVEPTFRNVITLAAGIGLALAYTLKDYGSSVVSGIVNVLETLSNRGTGLRSMGYTVK